MTHLQMNISELSGLCNAFFFFFCFNETTDKSATLSESFKFPTTCLLQILVFGHSGTLLDNICPILRPFTQRKTYIFLSTWPLILIRQLLYIFLFIMYWLMYKHFVMSCICLLPYDGPQSAETCRR